MADLDQLLLDPEYKADKYEPTAPERLCANGDWPGNWRVIEFGNGTSAGVVNASTVYEMYEADTNTLPRDMVGWSTRGTYGYSAFAFRVYDPEAKNGTDVFTGAFALFGRVVDRLHDGSASLDDDKLGRRHFMVQLKAIDDNWPGLEDRPDHAYRFVNDIDDDPPPDDHWTRKVFKWLWDNDQASLELEHTQEGEVCHITEEQVYKACAGAGILAGPGLTHTAFPGGYVVYYYRADDVYCHECAGKLPPSATKAGGYSEGPDMDCDGCGTTLESDYGDPEDDKEDDRPPRGPVIDLLHDIGIQPCHNSAWQVDDTELRSAWDSCPTDWLVDVLVAIEHPAVMGHDLESVARELSDEEFHAAFTFESALAQYQYGTALHVPTDVERFNRGEEISTWPPSNALTCRWNHPNPEPMLGSHEGIVPEDDKHRVCLDCGRRWAYVDGHYYHARNDRHLDGAGVLSITMESDDVDD